MIIYSSKSFLHLFIIVFAISIFIGVACNSTISNEEIDDFDGIYLEYYPLIDNGKANKNGQVCIADYIKLEGNFIYYSMIKNNFHVENNTIYVGENSHVSKLGTAMGSIENGRIYFLGCEYHKINETEVSILKGLESEVVAFLGPGLDYDKLEKKIQTDDLIYIYNNQVNDDWLKIRFKSNDIYILQDFVEGYPQSNTFTEYMLQENANNKAIKREKPIKETPYPVDKRAIFGENWDEEEF